MVKNNKKIQIKICGLTNEEDLRLAQELGADYAGFVFYPQSPRFTEPKKVIEMIRNLRARSLTQLSFVGIFVNETMVTVRRIYTECGLDIVQLHGDETPEYGRELGLPFWKVVRVKDKSSLQYLDRFPGSTFLLEAYADGFYGGSGRNFSLDLARIAVASGHRIIVAGGVSTENLPGIMALHPFAVDVSSSLEEYPGKKSEWKMRKFFEKIQDLRGGS